MTEPIRKRKRAAMYVSTVRIPLTTTQGPVDLQEIYAYYLRLQAHN
jgi:hypothetical protein